MHARARRDMNDSKSVMKHVRAGVAWSTLNTAWIKSLSVCLHVALGTILQANDWGIYAVATSFTGIALTLREGGIYDLYIQRGAGSRRLDGATFFLGLTVHVLTGICLLIAGKILAAAYDRPVLLWICACTASAVILSSPSQFYKARIKTQFGFRTLARVSIATITLQNLAVLACALMGCGPLSFVLPLPLIAIFELTALHRVARSKPWSHGPNTRLWRPMGAKVGYLMLGAAISTCMTMGDYTVIGAILGERLVGFYYFGFQLVAHATALASTSVPAVVFPVLSRSDTTASRELVTNAFSALSIISTVVAFSLLLAADGLERLLWGGKWADAMPVVKILCLAMPLRLTWPLVSAVLKSKGEFKLWCQLAFYQSSGLLLVAGLSAYALQALSGVVWWISGFFAIASLTIVFAMSRIMSMSASAHLRGTLTPWLLGLASLAIVHALPLPELIYGSFVLDIAIFLAVFLGLLRLSNPRCLLSLQAFLPTSVWAALSNTLRLAT